VKTKILYYRGGRLITFKAGSAHLFHCSCQCWKHLSCSFLGISSSCFIALCSEDEDVPVLN